MKAVVMAGGEGSRLRPLTMHRPKPLIPICNRPIMEHILSLLSKHGIQEAIVTTHYLSDEIEGYFNDGEDFGVNIIYSIEDSPLGTAGSVKKAEKYLQEGTFLIISGDALTDCDLSKAIAYHQQKKGLATIVLSRVENPLEYGVVVLSENGQISRFLEKPSWSEVFSDTVNTGIYIFEPQILELMEKNKPCDWSKDIFPELLQKNIPVYGYVMDGFWCDVGTLSEYKHAHDKILSQKTKIDLLYRETKPGIWIEPHCTIDESAILIPPLYIGRGSKIKKNATLGPYSVIGENTLIEERAHIEHSIILDSAYIGPNVTIQAALLGSRVTVKKDSYIHENAVVGDRCLLDLGSIIKSGVKIWPDKFVERGAILTMSLIWGNTCKGSLFRDLGVAGLSNIEITPEFATRLGSAFGSLLPNQSKVITCRDNSRSSRMIKRAIIASLLSVGCNVIDLRNVPIPLARYYLKTSKAAGAMNIRKLPGNRRMTLIELIDGNGVYIPKALERKVETAFFREDFLRIDSEDLGEIGYGARLTEEYQSDYFDKLIPRLKGKRLKLACDFGYGTLGAFFPMMLGKMGIESINLNSYSDAKKAPRTPDEIRTHMENLRQITNTLECDFGVLFFDEGERLSLVDPLGRVLSGYDLLALISLLTARSTKGAKLALSITAPTRLKEKLVREGVKLIECKASPAALVREAVLNRVDLAGDHTGGFLFPVLHSGFDAMACLGKLIEMLQCLDVTLLQVVDTLPKLDIHYEIIRCPWDQKGKIMRELSDTSGKNRLESIDGIKIQEQNCEILLLPDQIEPIFHIYGEGPGTLETQKVMNYFTGKIRRIIESAS